MSQRAPYALHRALIVALMLMPLGLGAGHAREERDHDRARKAVAAGEVLPLRVIVERVEHTHPGQIMEVELERKGVVWVYEIKLLRKGGALVKLKIDARDGTLLDIKERDDKRR